MNEFMKTTTTNPSPTKKKARAVACSAKENGISEIELTHIAARLPIPTDKPRQAIEAAFNLWQAAKDFLSNKEEERRLLALAANEDAGCGKGEIMLDEAMNRTGLKTAKGLRDAIAQSRHWRRTGDLIAPEASEGIPAVLKRSGYAKEVIEFFEEPIFSDDVDLVLSHRAAKAAERQARARAKTLQGKSTRKKRKAKA